MQRRRGGATFRAVFFGFSGTLCLGFGQSETIMATPPIILQKLPERHVPLAQALAWAAKKRGISRWRIGFDIVKRLIGRQKLLPDDYFMYGLHRGELSDADRACFIGARAVKALNKALIAESRGLAELLNDKVKMAMVLERAGLPTTEIRAVFVTQGTPGPWPVLRSATEIATYLLTPGHLPVFGKPMAGSRSIGAMSIVAAQGDLVELGDGRRLPALDLAQEIVGAFSNGYMFQELLRPHPQIERLSGPAIASVRVMTLWLNGAAVPLYAMLRLPGKGAMADDIGGGVSNTMTVLDMTTGQITRAHFADQLGGTTIDISPVTGVPLVGAVVPDMGRILDLAKQAHALFAQHGAIGTDIVLTDRGAVINELNPSPLQGNFQRTSHRGLLNPDFRPLYLAALAEKGITKPRRGLPLP